VITDEAGRALDIVLLAAAFRRPVNLVLATAALTVWLKSSKSKRTNPILPATRLKNRVVVPRPHLQTRLQRWPEPCAINSAWSYLQALE